MSYLKYRDGRLEVLLLAGLYWIGDPCYTDFEHSLEGQDYYWNGTNTVIAPTAVGDGEYYDGAGRAYGVDSASLAIMPALGIAGDIAGMDSYRANGGWVHRFNQAYEFIVNEGIFYIDGLVIDTNA